jgi:hypothetical protein
VFDINGGWIASDIGGLQYRRPVNAWMDDGPVGIVKRSDVLQRHIAVQISRYLNGHTGLRRHDGGTSRDAQEAREEMWSRFMTEHSRMEGRNHDGHKRDQLHLTRRIRMNGRNLCVCCIVGLVFFVRALASSIAAEADFSAAELSVGVAVTEITPTQGAMHDPLLAKAIVFSQGDCRAALVVCDQIKVGEEFCETVRALAADKTGIPESNISITATHTHTGRKHRDDASERIAEAIHTAFKQAKPATLHTGTARQETVISRCMSFV